METRQQLDCEGKPSAVFFPLDCFILVYKKFFFERRVSLEDIGGEAFGGERCKEGGGGG